MRSGCAVARVVVLTVVSAAMVLVTVTACGSSPANEQSKPTEVPIATPTVIAQIPHDPAAFTEGLAFDGPALYESTGLFGQSQLRELDPATGAVIRSVNLAPDMFGEGIAIVGNKIWQLTWRNGVTIEWDKATFTQLRQVPITGEGWGLCNDGNRLIRSDGTDKLRFQDPNTFAETGSVSVTYKGTSFTGLNELECVDGQVWANVFPTDQIARIDPLSGKVTAVVGARIYNDPARTKDQVLNGIAYAGAGDFLLTGKNWPVMYRVRFDSLGGK